MNQKPYTIEQYQRCLKAATKLSYAVYDMKTYPLTTDILKEVYQARKEYEEINITVVNESCGLE